MGQPFQEIQLVVFDWAGTTVDHGCLAPAIVFQEIFRRRGVRITAAEARGPMGMSKREHIATLANLDRIRTAWSDLFGSAPGDADVDAMYADFLPLQQETLKQHSNVIDGVVETVRRLQARGLPIGSSTGYTRELMQVVTPAAAAQGYSPDAVFCADDVPFGRPAPWLLFANARQCNAYPMWRVVKVDDTPVGMEAAVNAGAWAVGVTRTGNQVGKSVEELESLSQEQRKDLLQSAEAQLREGGAQFIVESVADIEPLLDDIEARLKRGERPAGG